MTFTCYDIEKLVESMTSVAGHTVLTRATLVESTVASRACFQFIALYYEVRVAHCSPNTATCSTDEWI